MTRIPENGEELRIVRLLASFRGAEPDLDVVERVSMRIRRLPVPQASPPLVSLRAFGWSVAAAFSAIGVGALGLLGSLGASGLGIASAAGMTLTSAVRGVARAAASRMLELASQAPSPTPLVDGAVQVAGQLAVLVFAAMVVLTVIVVSHEARTRRIAG